MEGFRQFFEQTEEQDRDVKNTLAKLPKSHAKLVKGYKIKWGCDNVLGSHDDKHVGLLNPSRKTITISAPWRYSREHVLLHEVAHQVWTKFMTPELISKWEKIVANTKNKLKQNAEELFCHAYASYFSDNKVVVHTHPEWEKFLAEFIKMTK